MATRIFPTCVPSLRGVIRWQMDPCARQVLNMNKRTCRYNSRARAVLFCFLLLLPCGIIVSRRWNLYLQDNHKRTFHDESYIRDQKGYLYPKEYFQSLGSDDVRHFQNLSLAGRHSDTVLGLSECRHQNGLNPALTSDEFQMAPYHNAYISIISIGASIPIVGPFDYLKNYKNPCWYDKGELNKTLVCIPYFYFIGTPKAGSTDLFWRIQMHQDVARVSDKEHRWFDRSRFLDKNKTNFSYYTRKFDRAARAIQRNVVESGNYHHRIVGDGSPSYLFNNNHWYRMPGNEWCIEPRVISLSYIHHLLPSAKLILIVRNPVDRLYSDYLFNSHRTGANRSAGEFHVWAEATIHDYVDCFKQHPFRYCLYSKDVRYHSRLHTLAAGIYSRLLLDALKLFPRNQMLVIQMEDYSLNMYHHLEQVFQFLGLDPLPESRMKQIVDAKQFNKGKHYKTAGPMHPATRQMLQKFYQPFNEELADILEDEKYLWLEE